jgi:hypothetical protein
MASVWSKVGDKIEKHAGPRPMLQAAIRVNFAVNMGGADASTCGIYKRDPAKHPGEPDVLPAQLEKARKARVRDQLKRAMRGR